MDNTTSFPTVSQRDGGNTSNTILPVRTLEQIMDRIRSETTDVEDDEPSSIDTRVRPAFDVLVAKIATIPEFLGATSSCLLFERRYRISKNMEVGWVLKVGAYDVDRVWAMYFTSTNNDNTRLAFHPLGYPMEMERLKKSVEAFVRRMETILNVRLKMLPSFGGETAGATTFSGISEALEEITRLNPHSRNQAVGESGSSGRKLLTPAEFEIFKTEADKALNLFNLLTKARTLPQFMRADPHGLVFREVYPISEGIATDWMMIVDPICFRRNVVGLGTWVDMGDPGDECGNWVKVASALPHYRPRLEMSVEKFIPQLKEALGVQLPLITEYKEDHGDIMARGAAFAAVTRNNGPLPGQSGRPAETIIHRDGSATVITWARTQNVPGN